MVDTVAIVTAHALLALMIWRLWQRNDLDHEDIDVEGAGFNAAPPKESSSLKWGGNNRA